MHTHRLAALVILGALALSGGCGARSPQVGSTVEVQFQRNLLGTASTVPVPPATSNQDGADVSVAGTLTALNDDWVVITDQKSAGAEYWIPRDVVLLIRVEKQPQGGSPAR